MRVLVTGGTGFIGDWIGRLAERRDRVLASIQRINGLTCATPEGAFYLFVNCQGLYGKQTPDGKVIADDFDFASYLLDAAKVGTVHGSAFGTPGYLRIAYAVDDQLLDQACQRIEAACGRLA